MEATEAITEVVPGIRLREEDSHIQDMTLWVIEEGEGERFVKVGTVRLQHPRLDMYVHASKPITDATVSLETFSRGFRSAASSFTPPVGAGIAMALGWAYKKAEEIREELEPQVSDRLKAIEKREKERAEWNQKLQELRTERQAIIDKWIEDATEVLKWLEGQPGRLKQRTKKGYDVFHELGTVNRDLIYWTWQGRRFSGPLSGVTKIEIKYESERSFTPVDNLPVYPQEELNKIDRKVEELHRNRPGY